MFLGVLLLLHGHERREVGLIIGEHQRGAVTLAGWDLQGQVDSPKGNRGECCRKPRRLSARPSSCLARKPSAALCPPRPPPADPGE